MRTKIFMVAYTLFLGATAGAFVPENHIPKLYPYAGTALPDDYEQDGPSLHVAIYHDAGVWTTGFEHLKKFFKDKHYSWAAIDSKAVREGWLTKSRPDVFVMPGGESWKYLEKLADEGADEIRQFVLNGGGYVGVCAGAFYATSDRLGGHATGPYGIGLLNGTAYDGTALNTAPFLEGMMDFDIDVPSFPATLKMVLFGGPSFRYSDEEAQSHQIQVIARFQTIHEPAMIAFNYGVGRVFLTGPHLEIEENLESWPYQDPESDWPLLEQMFSSVAPR